MQEHTLDDHCCSGVDSSEKVNYIQMKYLNE